MARHRYNPIDSAIRRSGVFPTPLPFAKKACEYLENLLGNDALSSGKYRLWDMAAGTGNLELFLPKEFWQYCYLSTLEQKDVEVLEKQFPTASVFRYDYLNNDVEQLGTDGRRQTADGGREDGEAAEICRLPAALKNDLANPEIKWIILVNPPYATAQEAGLTGKSKEGVSDTEIRKQMHLDGLGEVSRELYVQFLYRIMNEFKHRQALLGLFAPLKYLVSANYQRFRDNVFHAAFHSGFLFSSENFGGTSKKKRFPVSFILWDIHSELPGRSITEQEIDLDILDNTTHKIGTKTVKSVNRSNFLSRWIKRPRGIKIFPPFSSALTIKSGNVDTRNRIAEGFLASLMCPGNELQNQQQTAFLSGPQVSAGALSVTPENFEQAVVVFAARRIPKDTWSNHVDQLMKPNREPAPQFISDCAVWSLFDNKNQTVSLGEVLYQGQIYKIVNHFFPFLIFPAKAQRTQRGEKITWCPSCLCDNNDNNNSFAANWLAQQQLSEEAQAVLDSAKQIYQLYFAHFSEPHDAGWYQIQKALQGAKLGDELLADLKPQHEQLKAKILPLLYDYGILHETS